MANVKTNKKFSVASLIAIILTVLIVGMFVCSLIDFGGLKLRFEKSVKTDNFELSGAKLSYLYKKAFNEWYSQYYYYIYFGYITYDSSVSMKDQEISEGTTYYEYFKTLTTNTAKQIIYYNEAAKADSTVDYKALEKEAKEYVKNNIISELKEAAKSNSVTVSYYIANVYGASVRQSDIEYCEKLSYIASSYYTTLKNRINDAVTDDEINKQFEDNLATYVTAEVLKYTMKSTYAVATVNASDYEGGEDSEEYKNAVAEAKKTAKEKNDAQKEVDDLFKLELAKAEKDDDFIKLVLEREFDNTFDSTYTTAVKEFADEDKPSDEVKDAFKNDIKTLAIDAVMDGKTTFDVEEDEESELTKWEDAKEEFAKSLVTALDEVKSGLTTSLTYNLKEDVEKWVFGGIKATYGIEYAEGEDAEGTSAVLGETKAFETVDDADAGKYTLNVYRVTKAAERDTSATKNYGHILFSTDDYEDDDAAKAKAEEILAQIKAGTLDKETFEKYGKEYTGDSNVFYDNSADGDTVLDDWLFDEEREAGDIDVVESDYGAHIVYLVGDGIETWKKNAWSAVTDSKLSDWYQALNYNFNITDSVFDEIIK